MWAVDFQAETGTSEYILGWDPDLLVEGNFELTDAFGGTLIMIDMQNNSTANSTTALT